MFEEMGKEMKEKRISGTNWTITKNTEEFRKMLYGDAKFCSQGVNKQAKICSHKRKIRSHKRKTNNNNENGDTKIHSQGDNKQAKVHTFEREENDGIEGDDGLV